MAKLVFAVLLTFLASFSAGALTPNDIKCSYTEAPESSAQTAYSVVDSLAFVTAKWEITDLGKGAQASYAQVTMFNSVQSISVIRYPAKKFRTEILHRPGETAGTPSSIGNELGAAFVVNGGYFHVKERIPSVFVKKDGRTLGYTHPSELYRVDGILGFKDKKGRKMEVVHCPDSLNYASVTQNMKSAMATGPLLILEDKIVVPVLMGEEYNTLSQFYDRRHPRTAIGTDESGNIYMVVIDGRFKGQADGASIYETAFICHLLGMTNAINLDGGGSSALWSRQTGVINHPSDNRKFDHEGQRPVPNLIVVY